MTAILQDTFNQYADIAYHAQLNTDFPRWVDSFHAEGSSIGFGVAVSRGTLDTQAVLGGANTSDIIGVTLRTHAVENDIAGIPTYDKNRLMSVLKKGRMYLRISDGSVNGAQVYVVPATGEIVSTAADNVALDRAEFVRTTAAGGITEIEIK